MIISLIAAIGKNNELGKGNTLLWHMPTDMKYFRDTTRDHTVIMGRKTFESLSGPLPKRRNIVITRDSSYTKNGIEIAHSLEEAIKIAEDTEEIFIIGGAEIYKQAMPLADKLYITHIEAEEKSADTFFPKIKEDEWKQIWREEHNSDDKNVFKYIFVVYAKKI